MAAPRSTPSFNRASPNIDSCGTPCPSCQASGVVGQELSVPSIIPAAPKLPTAEARGANGFAAIKDPKVICVTPRRFAQASGRQASHETARSTGSR